MIRIINCCNCGDEMSRLEGVDYNKKFPFCTTGCKEAFYEVRETHARRLSQND